MKIILRIYLYLLMISAIFIGTPVAFGLFCFSLNEKYGDWWEEKLEGWVDFWFVKIEHIFKILGDES